MLIPTCGCNSSIGRQASIFSEQPPLPYEPPPPDNLFRIPVRNICRVCNSYAIIARQQGRFTHACHVTGCRLNSVSAFPGTLISSKLTVYLLKDHDPVGLSASRLAAFS